MITPVIISIRYSIPISSCTCWSIFSNNISTTISYTRKSIQSSVWYFKSMHLLSNNPMIFGHGCPSKIIHNRSLTRPTVIPINSYKLFSIHPKLIWSNVYSINTNWIWHRTNPSRRAPRRTMLSHRLYFTLVSPRPIQVMSFKFFVVYVTMRPHSLNTQHSWRMMNNPSSTTIRVYSRYVGRRRWIISLKMRRSRLPCTNKIEMTLPIFVSIRRHI